MSFWDWVRAAATVVTGAILGLIIGTLGLLTLLTVF
jgi:hypothetical protein